MFSATFRTSGDAWANVTSSVYLGTWEGDRDEAANPLLTSLSDPYPNKDYLCIAQRPAAATSFASF